MSFWGQPRATPKSRDVAKFIGVIREAAKNKTKDKALEVATSFVMASAWFIANEHGEVEAVSVLEKAKSEILAVQQ